MKKTAAALCVMIALSACSFDRTTPAVAVNRAPSSKIALDVKTITLADRSSLQVVSSPYNTEHFSPTISEAIKQWAIDRLQANGQTGEALIIVKKASLVAQPIPVGTGFMNWFTNLFTRQQSLKYIGYAEVSIEAQGRSGFAVTDATATRTTSLPENPTTAEKQDAYITLLNGLMKDLGENLESGIHTHMANFITAAPVYGATAVPAESANETAKAVSGQPAAPSLQDTKPPATGSAFPENAKN